jgi:hypothetical protein
MIDSKINDLDQLQACRSLERSTEGGIHHGAQVG